MFLISNIVGTILLMMEGQLAYMAFSGLDNTCGEGDPAVFPCKVNPLFNENFQGIPIIGPICQFYPMLNVSAVPILTITLRNNFMQVVPVKRWIRNLGCCQILLEDHRRLVKGLWSIIFSIPCIVIVMFVKKPQVMVTYTGGICGTFILLLIPMTLVWYGRKAVFGKHNPNTSYFQSPVWLFIVFLFSMTTFGFVITGIVNGTAGE